MVTVVGFCSAGCIAQVEVDVVVFAKGEVEDGRSDEMESCFLAQLQL